VAVKNKGGRPKGAVAKVTQDVRLWAQQHAHVAKRRLLQLVESKDEKVAVVAAKEVLNRAYGMPSQVVTADGALAQVFAGIKIVISDERGSRIEAPTTNERAIK